MTRRSSVTAVLSLVLCAAPMNSAGAAAQVDVLATFKGSVEGWRAYNPVSRTQWAAAPSVDGNGSLQVDVRLSGGGWSDVIVEGPELNRDFSGFHEIRARVLVPSRGLRASVFAKSGGAWSWDDGGWQPLTPGTWTVVTLPVSRITHPSQVRSVGVKIGGNDRFTGAVLIDLVEVERAAAGPRPSLAVESIEIVPDSRIVGRVLGLPPARAGDYKVLIYVKTNKWYIHPYERGGKGRSFAALNPDGSFQIETVKRAFLADFVAVLVVESSFAPPATVEDLAQIPAVLTYIEPGKNRL
jgi:mannanase-like protein